VNDEKVRIGGHAVALSNPDKVLFDAVNGYGAISKHDLAAYYEDVASAMVPHLRDRPLAVQRFPEGIDGDGFMQKQTPPKLPSWVHHRAVDRVQGGTVAMYVCDNAATLVYLANQAALTLHPWLSRTRNLHRPDRLIFDLDPASDDDFGTVRLAARTLHGILDDLGLHAYAMTTGSRGVHVTVPIDGKDDFDTVRVMALDIARALVDRHPDRLTTAVRKADRKGRLFVDTLRNAYAQHAVAPYSVRPLPGAPVAAPLDWSELDDAKLTARTFALRDIRRRLDETHGDLWKGMARNARSLRAAHGRLGSRDGTAQAA
jgi:bifunctional non-homologous end joining protein LigD